MQWKYLIVLWVRITVIVQEGLKLTYYYVIRVIAQEVLIIVILVQEGLYNS